MKTGALNLLQKVNFNQSQSNSSVQNMQLKNLQYSQLPQTQIQQSQKFERFTQLISQQQMEIEQQNNQLNQQQLEYQQNKIQLQQELQFQEEQRNQQMEKLKENEQAYLNQDFQQDMFNYNLTQFEEIDESVLPSGYKQRQVINQEIQEEIIPLNDQFNQPLELKNVESFQKLKSIIPSNQRQSLESIKYQLSKSLFYVKVELAVVTLKDYQIMEDRIFCIFEDESGIILGSIDQDIIVEDLVQNTLIYPKYINLKKGSSFILQNFTAFKDKQKIFYINIVQENIQQIQY